MFGMSMIKEGIDMVTNTLSTMSKELKELKQTIELIERFLGEDYQKLKEAESAKAKKDEDEERPKVKCPDWVDGFF